jgi:hypothetical protein
MRQECVVVICLSWSCVRRDRRVGIEAKGNTVTKFILKIAATLAVIVISVSPNSSTAQTRIQTGASPNKSSTVVFYRQNQSDIENSNGAGPLAYISNCQPDGTYWTAKSWSGELHFYHIGKNVNYQQWAADTPSSYIFDSGTHEQGK